MNKITALHYKLVADHPEYRKYVTAKTDADSVCGFLTGDTFYAAMILQRADASLSTLKLNDIKEVLHELIGRPAPSEEEKQESRESRQEFRAFYMEMEGLDEADMERIQQMWPKPKSQ